MGWGDSRERAGSGRRGGGSVSEDPRRGKADLHVHTASGDGMASPRQILDYVEAETDLDVIAVTDHDDLRGALEAREVCARGRYRFQVITGMEVTAIEGHIIALWVEEPLPSLRPVEEGGGSAARCLKAIGSAYTESPGHSADDLRRCILERSCHGVNGRHPSILEIGPLQGLRPTWRGLRVTPRPLG